MSRVLNVSYLYGNRPALTSQLNTGQTVSVWALGLGVLLSLCSDPALGQTQASAKPELILVIAVDQLRRDRLLQTLPGGLGKLLRGGRVYVNAQLEHALSTTCPGHATILTGRHPGPIGVPDNAHLERGQWQQRYCVADPQSPLLQAGLVADDKTEIVVEVGVDAEVEVDVSGRSPALINATTLGDWLQQADPQAQVLSIGGKDRAVIALAGKRPSAAIWFDRKQGRFNTSRYYATELPGWVAPKNLPGLLAALPDRWTHAPGQLRADDYVGESEEFNRTSGHPLGLGDLESVAQQFYASPWIDAAVLQLAQRAIATQSLLTNQHTDLLALSLPATDTVGHLYGPFSAESADTLQRLDAGLGKLLESMEAQTAPGQLLVVLTADHGVAALPEWLQEQNAQRCPVAGGRVSGWRVLGGLLWHVYRKFSAPFGLPQRLVGLGGTMLYVTKDPKLLGKHSHAEVVADVEAYLESQPYVTQAWTAAEISEQAPTNPLAQLYLNSYSEAYSGDLLLQLEPGCQLSSSGTTHGSPYAYDRDIPLVFYGASVVPGNDVGRAASVDIATTIARLLQLPTPAGLDGRELPVTSAPEAKLTVNPVEPTPGR